MIVRCFPVASDNTATCPSSKLPPALVDTEKSMAVPPGSGSGHECLVSFCPASRVVNGSAVPPAAFTRNNDQPVP